MNILEEIPETATTQSKPVFSSNSEMTALESHDSHIPMVSQKSDYTLSSYENIFDSRNFIIIILLFVILLTYVGVNIISIMGSAIQNVVDLIVPAFTELLRLLGYSTGTIINTGADITADVAKDGIDIAEGTVQSVGNLLIGDKAIGQSQTGGRSDQYRQQDPMPDSPEDSIQKSLNSSKVKWCLAGEYQNKRGCISITESDKCMSGQVFPTEEMCLNPTFSKK